MSSTNGLKGKVKQLVSEMNAKRTNATRPRDISLREHLAEDYDGLTPDHLFSELGIEPQYTRGVDIKDDEDMKYLLPEVVRQGLQAGMGVTRQQAIEAMRRAVISQGSILSEGNGGERWISPEVFLDPVQTGAVQAAYWQELIVGDEPVSQDSVNIPYFNLSDAAPEDTDEGATAVEGSVDYGHRKVVIKERKKALKISDAAIMFNSLSLISRFMLDFGRLLGLQLNADAAGVIVNGDQADGVTMNSPVIGVSDPTKGFQYRDFLRVGIRFNQLGRVGLSAIADEDTALEYLDLPEVKNKQFAGSPLMAVKFKSATQTPEDLYASFKVPANQIAIQDSAVSLIKLTARPLMVETERIVMKGINGTVARTYTGFAKLNRNASVRMDKTLAYADHQFPDWMSPYGSN